MKFSSVGERVILEKIGNVFSKRMVMVYVNNQSNVFFFYDTVKDENGKYLPMIRVIDGEHFILN